MRKNKSLVYCLAIANLLSAGTFTVFETTANAYERQIVLPQGVVNTNDLNVRTDAGTSYPSFAKLQKGAKVKIKNTKNDWYEIEHNNKKGYVFSKYIDLVVTHTGVVKGASSLNVRSGATSSSSKLGSLKEGTKVEILNKENNGWYKIKYKNTYGYVSGDYIGNVIAINNTNSNTNNVENVTHTGIISATSLNVRNGANTSSNKIGTLSKGTKIEIVKKENNGWYKIKYGSGYGYVSGDYVDNVTAINTSTTPPATETLKVTHTGNVNTDTLNVRSGAGTSYTKLGTVTKGTKIEIVEKTNNWYKIKYKDGYGYVSGDYVNNVVAINTPTTPKPETPNNVLPVLKTGVINTESLNVRSGYGTSYSVIGTLKKNTKVEIVDESNGWYKIKYKDGYGFISGAYVELTTTQTTPTPEQPKPTPETPSTPSTPETVINKGEIINTAWLNVRSGAGLDYPVIGSIAEGTIVEITKNENGWYRIKYKDGYGYVGGNYVKLQTSTPQEKPSTTPEAPSVPEEKPSDSNNKPIELPTPNGTIVNTNYDFTLEEYIKEQQASNPKYTLNDYRNYIDPSKAKNMFQFLRINTFRNIDVNMLNTKLKDKGVLSGQAQAIVDACKKQNIDPIYFTSQSLHETGNGTSTLAKGITITEIADTTKEIRDENNNLIGYEMIQLESPVTVYNLYGIGAHDNLPTFPNRAIILGTTHAYKNGWTSVAKAIEGASEFVSKNYANSTKYQQNTIFKYRYNQSKNYLWHQYATSPWYAESIGNTMDSLKSCYTSDNTFVYDIPVFKE